jgi:hypothetical protein
MKLLLRDLWRIDDVGAHKAHFAKWNGHDHPLDVWTRDPAEWDTWQAHRPHRDDFNRPFVFALMQVYHEQDAWLFGGVYRIAARHADRYEVELTDSGAALVGRLKLRSSYRQRQPRVNLENHYDDFEVVEILREPYSGRPFPGYEDVHLTLAELHGLVRNGRPDWAAALESVKGVYLLTDARTGRRYVGSAYGARGIWGRWCEYADTGHGGNAELRELVDGLGVEPAAAEFTFALLEHRSFRTPDEVVLAREAYWKRILGTRGPDGLNRN